MQRCERWHGFQHVLLETGIIIAAALLLMALIMLNFRDFVEDTVVVKLSTLLAPERIWVPLSVVLLLFIVGGVLPGRLFARIPVSQVFRRYTEGEKGLEASVAVCAVCRRGIHQWIDVCGDVAISVCTEKGYGGIIPSR